MEAHSLDCLFSLISLIFSSFFIFDNSIVKSVSDGPIKIYCFFFVNQCMFVALPGKGSWRMWRQEEVPAFPSKPSPTHPTCCCQHKLVNKKKSLDFVWPVTYGHNG